MSPQDDSSFAVGLTLEGLSPVRAATSTTALPQRLAASRAEASEPDLAAAYAYFDNACGDLPDLALCKAVGHYDFSPAYKMYVNVRLLPRIVDALGGKWPKTGLPTKPWVVPATSPPLSISFEQLLSFCKAPASGTFSNHYGWVKQTTQAIQLLDKERVAGRLEGLEDLEDLMDWGASLHALTQGQILDPSPRNFVVPRDYGTITTVTIAETQRWVRSINSRFNKTSGRR